MKVPIGMIRLCLGCCGQPVEDASLTEQLDVKEPAVPFRAAVVYPVNLTSAGASKMGMTRLANLSP